MKKILKTVAIFIASIAVIALSFMAYKKWKLSQIPEGLEEVADGDSIFWLMQKETNRYSTCVVDYSFESPLDASIVLERLKDLTNTYKMFHRNVVMVEELPFWQEVAPDWNQNFRILDATEDMEAVRIKADYDISQSYELGEGLPLFRAYLSTDRRRLLYVWHHIVSDYEGMFNKHAKHLFSLNKERTKYGYQMNTTAARESSGESMLYKSPLAFLSIPERKKGFIKTEFEVEKLILPIKDKELKALGEKADLPMSDIFSFIATRAITHYHQNIKDDEKEEILPLLSPLSLRKSSLEIDEGNNRAIKLFPFVFPLEGVEEMYQRMATVSPAASSYETLGKNWKTMRQVPYMETILLRKSMCDYISNYFPLADETVTIDTVKLAGYHLRVTMSPFERAKFAWSNYNGEVQLYLHTDPILIDKRIMIQAYEKALDEILQFLENYPVAVN